MAWFKKKKKVKADVISEQEGRDAVDAPPADPEAELMADATPETKKGKGWFGKKKKKKKAAEEADAIPEKAGEDADETGDDLSAEAVSASEEPADIDITDADEPVAEAASEVVAEPEKAEGKRKGWFGKRKKADTPDEIAEEPAEADVTGADEPVAEAEPEVVAEPEKSEGKRKGWFGKKKADTPEETEPDVPTEEDVAEEIAVEKAPADEPETVAMPSDEALPEPEAGARDDAPAKSRNGLFGRLRQGLSKTRDILTTDIDELFLGNRKIDDDLLEEIEELLITSDMGVQTTMTLMEKIEKKAAKISGANELKAVIREEICQLMASPASASGQAVGKPHIIMVVGVNGVGKTTTIGKLAAQFADEGKSVLLAAADTFRAAAVEQLDIWAERSGADIVKHRENADPAAVAYDAVEAAVARDKDIVIVDTAGRLHTKVNLMEEIKKIRRAIAKKIPDAPHEVLLVLDATTGQNALSQASLFNEALGLTSLALTKLDGTAKGGVVVSICNSLEIPLKYIGVGERIDDLQKFDPAQFADALFS